MLLEISRGATAARIPSHGAIGRLPFAPQHRRRGKALLGRASDARAAGIKKAPAFLRKESLPPSSKVRHPAVTRH
jgi:hypothetical protein